MSQKYLSFYYFANNYAKNIIISQLYTKSHNRSTAKSFALSLTSMYVVVVLMDSCPISFWMTSMATPFSAKSVPNVCRAVWKTTHLDIPARLLQLFMCFIMVVLLGMSKMSPSSLVSRGKYNNAFLHSFMRNGLSVFCMTMFISTPSSLNRRFSQEADVADAKTRIAGKEESLLDNRLGVSIRF